MLDKTTFNNWLSDFFNKKSNELEYSRVSQPKRMQKVTLSLATASVDPVQVNVPFKTLIVSRIYSTSVPATDKSGSIKIMFDQDNIANIDNAISLFPNDTLRSGTLVTKAFLTWAAQSDTSIDLYFYPDIEVVAGTTKTQIVGTVSVINSTSNALYNKLQKPDLIVRQAVLSGNTGSIAAKTGYYARVTGIYTSGGNAGYFAAGGVRIVDTAGSGNIFTFDFTLLDTEALTWDVKLLQYLNFQVEYYLN